MHRGQRNPEQMGVRFENGVEGKLTGKDGTGESDGWKAPGAVREKSRGEERHQSRQQTAEAQNEDQGRQHRLRLVATQRGNKHGGREREEHRVDHGQCQAPVFTRRDAPQQQGDPERRQPGQQAVESGERIGDPFAENHIHAAEVGQKQQPEGSLPFLGADRVSRQERPGEEPVCERQTGQRREEGLGQCRGPLSRRGG